MQEAIVQVILESLKHSVWLSLSSIVHITCSLFVITLLSRFSRKTVSCSFLRTRTAWSSRARLSRANDGITSSCSKPFTDHVRYRRDSCNTLFSEKIRIERFHLRFVARFSRNELLRIYNDFIPSYRHAPNYRSFFFLPFCYASPALRRKKEAASERTFVGSRVK